MARALVNNPTYRIEGDDVVLTVTVLFYGRDLPNPDYTTVTVTLGQATTKTGARGEIRAAITAEAKRLGYAYEGAATLVDELLVGL